MIAERANYSNSGASIYIPGYKRCKFAVIGMGIILLVMGMKQLWMPVRLMIFGVPAIAEATRIIKTKEGAPDVILTKDLQSRMIEGERNHDEIFWNEFSFRTKDERKIIVIAPVGSRSTALFPLVDADGLPYVTSIRYAANAPQEVVFPLIGSTWFIPGMMIFLGFLCSFIGAFLFHWADKPIELPHIASERH